VNLLCPRETVTRSAQNPTLSDLPSALPAASAANDGLLLNLSR